MEKAVSKEELLAGVKLPSGKSVVLIVDGMKGTALRVPAGRGAGDPASDPKKPADGPARAPEDPPADPGIPASATSGDEPPAVSDPADPAVDPTPVPLPPEPEPPRPPPEATPSLLATLPGVHFEFDKALPLASVIDTCRAVATRAAADPERRIVVVGHTDDKGTSAYNLKLAEERATTLLAYLRDDVEAWMTFYDHSEHSRRWGTREDQLMLAALPHGAPPFLAAPGEAESAQSREAVRRFQADAGLSVDGRCGPQTRRALIKAYMGADGTTLPGGAKVEILGCGFFHPPEGPPADRAEWRRVEIYLFEEDPKPAPPECRNGAHPGCEVIEKWRKEAKPLPKDGFEPAAIESFSAAEAEEPGAKAKAAPGGEKLGITTAAGASGTPEVHEGQKATLSWTIAGEFSDAVIEPGTVDAKAASGKVGDKTKGAVQVLPTRAQAVGDEVTFTLTVTPKKGKPVVSKVVVKLVKTDDYFEHKTLRLGQAGTNDPATGTPLFTKFVKQVKADLRAVRFLPDGPAPDGTFGGDLALAIQRFKRAVVRPHRMKGSEDAGKVTRPPGAAPDVPAVAAGPLPLPDGVLDATNAKLLHEWVEQGLVRPFGRFQTKALTKAPKSPSIRADAADAWNAICTICDTFAIPNQGPYGDTLRPLGVGGASIPGSSSTSRHFVGIGIDFNIHYTNPGYFDCKNHGCYDNRRDPVSGAPLATPKEVEKAFPLHQRYFLEALDKTGAVVGLPKAGSGPFWRIWVRMDLPTPPVALPAGVATLVVTKAAPHKFVRLAGSPGYKPAPGGDQDPGLGVALANMPEGAFVDLSALIESTGLWTRIQAHDDYLAEVDVKGVKRQGTFKAAEFWHWTFCQDGESPFSKRVPLKSGGDLYSANVRLVDMADLMGIAETALTAAKRAPEGQCF